VLGVDPDRRRDEGPVVARDQVVFRFVDPQHRLSGVRLWQEVGVPGDLLGFGREGQAWTLVLQRPAVDRMEYRFELHHADGSTETVLDQANPRRCNGAFGDYSVVQFPGYRAPAWLSADAPEGFWAAGEADGAKGTAHVAWRLWSPTGLDPEDKAPLLLVHDGPEYDALASLTRCLAAEVASGALPPVRAALLEPGERDERYSANPAYSRALARSVLPAVRTSCPSTAVVGVGASLGALALLHAHRRHPDSLDGLLLQSGSFFQGSLDAQERRFPGFGRIDRFVRGVLDSEKAARPVPVVLTCGTVEENLANNRRMAAALAAQGYPARLVEVRDAHNYTAWRDSLLPALPELLRAVAG
jgi:enterochelin esterase-like enzyme